MSAALLLRALSGAAGGLVAVLVDRALSKRRRLPDWRNPGATWTERPFFRGQR